MGHVPPAGTMTDASRAIDDGSFGRLAGLVHRESGIVLSESKRSLVVSRLGRRIRELGLADFAAYCSYLDRGEDRAETQRLISLLTTNVTRFFREGHHFDALKSDLLPPLLNRARSGGRVRIWSAGCSSGEEPYSIAMCILALMPEASRHDIKVLGMDIDAEVIARARRGSYANLGEDDIPASLRKDFFEPDPTLPQALRVTTAARSLVTFNELNLLRDWPMRGPFDVIFCRNVVIYFDAETQAGLWRRFAEILAPGGTLFLGHSERIGPAEAGLFETTGVTRYQRR